MDKNAKVLVAGSRGLVGSAVVRRLEKDGYSNILTPPRSEVDLTVQASVNAYFESARPDFVLIAAAKVGGILANKTRPAEFIRDNLLIQTNIIDAAHRSEVQQLLFLGSSCIYPKHCEQPMKEEHLLGGYLEPTNQAYAIAKIAGIEMCRSYAQQYGMRAISLMPTNLYGPGDNFDLESSHVLPALLRKMHEAKESGAKSVTLWGSGSPRREFLHVDDLADACVFVMNAKALPHDLFNVGCGEDLTIQSLAEAIREVVGFEGDLTYDRSKPDGTPRKLLDMSRLHAMGWHHKIQLRDGLEQTYRWYLDNK